MTRKQLAGYIQKISDVLKDSPERCDLDFKDVIISGLICLYDDQKKPEPLKYQDFAARLPSVQMDGPIGR
jgi:hypothetical protein